jgi:eukaryotic-like serine/threonine-protein kinase
VRKALHEKQERLDPSVAPREEEELYDRALLAAAYGDFDAAIELAIEGSKRVAPERPLGAHGRFALLRVDIEREAGREKKAASVASDFLQRRDAWRQPEGPMTAPDPTVYLTRMAARANFLSEAEVRPTRDAWYRAQTLGTPLDKARAWWLAYAMGVESEGEAREALAVRPANAPWSNHRPWMDESTGRALWVGGHRAEALPYLERTFKSCNQLEIVMSAMRTNLLYGQALEAAGDHERACEVYGTITRRWGEAKPRSVTAEEARRHAQWLGCGVPLRPGENLEQG